MGFQVKVYSRIQRYLHDHLRKVENIQEYAYRGTLVASERFANYFKATYLSGHPIKVRTGALRRSVKPVVVRHGKSIKGGISWGNSRIPYSFVHINDRVGMKTIIVPVRRKYLTIPIGLNKNREIYNKATDIKDAVFLGDTIGRFEGATFVPYFALKTRVTLRSKVGVDEVMDEYRETFLRDVLSVVKERMKKESKGRK